MLDVTLNIKTGCENKGEIWHLYLDRRSKSSGSLKRTFWVLCHISETHYCKLVVITISETVFKY